MERVIEIHDIVKNYQVGSVIVRALRSVTINIDKNEYVAIMGPSGSGKSTLMNLLGCLDTPTSGRYILNSTDVSKMEDDFLAEIRNKEIGFVFQTFNLLPRYTALENVTLPLIYAGIQKVDREKMAMETMEQVGLGDRMNHKPNELSGGQRQRVAIARALVNKPSIILADEPTGNLDTKNKYEIVRLLANLNTDRGTTIVMVTHDSHVASRTERMLLLEDGKITKEKQGTHMAKGLSGKNKQNGQENAVTREEP